MPTRPIAAVLPAMTLFAALLAVTSCAERAEEHAAATLGNDESIETAPGVDQVSDDAAVVESEEGTTQGGDGSAIVLEPLSAGDIESAALPGELACSFAAGETGEEALLLARGNVASDEAARGVVKVGSYVEPVAAPGGFDAMLVGVTFSGAGKTVSIAITGEAREGGESPPRLATLTYQRADGAQRIFSGWWQCGP